MDEEQRLKEPAGTGWKRRGPYLSERQWGTAREDYSPKLLRGWTGLVAKLLQPKGNETAGHREDDITQDIGVLTVKA